MARSKAAAQSQGQRGHYGVNGTANSSPPSGMIAYVQDKEGYQKDPRNFTSEAVTAKEYELGQRLQEKETEISSLKAGCELEIRKKNQEIQSLLDERTTLKKEVKMKEMGMKELAFLFRAMLDKKNQKLEHMQGQYDTVLSIHRKEQENSKLPRRKADARARVLQGSLTTAGQELEACKDDLFRTQPLCQISYASIIDAFELLGEQIVNWIDDQAPAFEHAIPEVDVGSQFLLDYPSGGEYLCRHIVNRYLLEHTFGPNIHLFGVPAEYTHILAMIEQGKAAHRPPRGMRS